MCRRNHQHHACTFMCTSCAAVLANPHTHLESERFRLALTAELDINLGPVTRSCCKVDEPPPTHTLVYQGPWIHGICLYSPLCDRRPSRGLSSMAPDGASSATRYLGARKDGVMLENVAVMPARAPPKR